MSSSPPCFLRIDCKKRISVELAKHICALSACDFYYVIKSCHVCFTAAFEPIHRTNNEFTFVKYYYRMLVAIIEGCYFFLKFSLNDLHYP